MATLKYSKQREAIKDFILHTTSHPTADTVYLTVRDKFPNISLGTVYRNLNLLAELGEAIKITTAYGGDRFDGNTMPHYHICCTHCGQVYDLDMPPQDAIDDAARQIWPGTIENHETMFYGTCEHCLKKEMEKIS